MKVRRSSLLMLGAVILALLAGMWPLTRAAGEGRGVRALKQQFQQVAGLHEVQQSATALALRAEQVGKLSTRLGRPVEAISTDPFLVVLTKEEIEAARERDAVHEQTERSEAKPAEPTEDPFDMRKEQEWPDLALEGIVMAGGNSMVLINGSFYRQGDTIKGLMVSEITSQHVVIISPQGETRALELRGWDIEREMD